MTHPAVGDAATTEGSTRRKVLGAGLIGAALALTATRSAVATSGGALSEADLALLGFDQGFELAARDLYDAAIAGGADDPLMETLSEQHEAYAQAIAGLTGIPANQRNDDVFDEFSAGFSSGSLGDVLQTAYDLEATAAATQVELIAELVDLDSAKLLASIAAIEARHMTVLADVKGDGADLDALLLSTALPNLPKDNA